MNEEQSSTKNLSGERGDTATPLPKNIKPKKDPTDPLVEAIDLGVRCHALIGEPRYGPMRGKTVKVRDRTYRAEAVNPYLIGFFPEDGIIPPTMQRPGGNVYTQSAVSLQTLSNGYVEVVAVGRNGTLRLQITDGPTVTIADPHRGAGEEGRRYKYKACISVEANGRLCGWLVDEHDQIKRFDAIPQLKKTPRAKKPLRKATRKRATAKKAA